MIDELPDSGATIVVITEEIGRDLKETIREIRGDAVARRCKMISVHRRDQIMKIMGLSGEVVMHPSLAAYAKPDIFKEVYRLVAQTRAYQRVKSKEPA